MIFSKCGKIMKNNGFSIDNEKIEVEIFGNCI